MITFLSLMRDSAAYVERYFAQIEATRFESGRVVIVEGDSADDTVARLRRMRSRFRVDVISETTGAPRYQSVDVPERWAHLERCWNRAMAELLPCTWVVCVESDLTWTPDALDRQLGIVASGVAEVSCPLLMMGDLFYDTNGFRTHGQRWTNGLPYCPVPFVAGDLVPLDTGGGMLVGRYETMRLGVWEDHCRMHFPLSVRVVADTGSRIEHPSVV